MFINSFALEWLLKYEIQGAERYRRYLSLVHINSRIEKDRLHRLVESSMRDCDAVVRENDSVSVVMSDTQADNAVVALERLRRLLNQEPETFFSVAAFPGDGINSKDLIEKVKARLETARAEGPFSIVAGD